MIRTSELEAYNPHSPWFQAILGVSRDTIAEPLQISALKHHLYCLYMAMILYFSILGQIKSIENMHILLERVHNLR